MIFNNWKSESKFSKMKILKWLKFSSDIFLKIKIVFTTFIFCYIQKQVPFSVIPNFEIVKLKFTSNYSFIKIYRDFQKHQ